MGVLLTPIITKDTIALDALHGQTLAVDGNGELYQFLALIRLRDGTPLKDSKGRTTSHLSGLFYRTTRLIAEHALTLVFVFDGSPPPRKAQEIAKRRAVRSRYEEERVAALERGDIAAAYSKATMTSRLTKEMVSEARDLLRLMGVPTVQAPSEAEAQAAHMAATSPQVSAAASKDYDALLFGAPTLVRFLTISGKEMRSIAHFASGHCGEGQSATLCFGFARAVHAASAHQIPTKMRRRYMMITTTAQSAT
ncbi:MAG: hypothetical protein DMG00_09570 [Acidobacteria bacterium]|nr:MAG: hypothetical protein DMG00_09570 [Acidobacteriota bacterium]